MIDMNDFYVNEHCQTRIHIGGYVFTIEELYVHVITTMSFEELEKHEEENYKF